jgi:tol-pal system beta propeller repeat protein TolB
MKKYIPLTLALTLTLACALFATPAPPLTIETLQAQASAILPSRTAASLPDPETATPSPAVSSATAPAFDSPTGKIVFTCQVGNAIDQICIIHADGTGEQQLTSDSVKHWYPSLSPDGTRVFYSAYVKNYLYEIYEMNLANGRITPLTNSLGIAKAPEVSPDGRRIVFNLGKSDDREEIWVMDRDGSNPKRLQSRGWDPTWSPDGTRILFASDIDGAIQLYVMDADGSDAKRITAFDALRGRSDWSLDGAWMVTYNGPSWKRELFLFRPDFTDLHQLSPAGGNSQGPSFSPDGKWVAFTAYFDHFGDDLGCEIYLIRVDGTDLRRLTDNAYCDYQPRWGP